MNTIKIIGLGTSDVDKMPLGVYKSLKEAKTLYVRTLDHPAISMLRDEGVKLISFDDYYESADDFSESIRIAQFPYDSERDCWGRAETTRYVCKRSRCQGSGTVRDSRTE